VHQQRFEAIKTRLPGACLRSGQVLNNFFVTHSALSLLSTPTFFSSLLFSALGLACSLQLRGARDFYFDKLPSMRASFQVCLELGVAH
jgi:hypothetical protein